MKPQGFGHTAITLIILWGWPSYSWPRSVESAAQAFAEEQYHQALKLLPEHELGPESKLLRARAFIEVGQYDEAQKLLQGLQRDLPTFRDLIQLLQAEALMGIKKFPAAAAMFRKAARVKGSRWIDLARRREVEALEAAGYYRQAAKAYQSLLLFYPDHPHRPVLELALALNLEKSRERSKAALLLQNIWIQRPESDAAARARKELDRLLAAGIRLKAPNLSQRLQRIRGLRRAKRYQDIIDELLQLHQNPRTRRSPEETRLVETMLARTYLKSNQPPKALALLLENPNDPSTLRGETFRMLAALCFARVGNFEAGLQLLLSAQARGPYARKKMLSRAARFSLIHGRYRKAAELYDQLDTLLAKGQRRKNSVRKETLSASRAWLAYRSYQLDKAIDAMERLSRKTPKLWAFALYWQARAYEKAGQREAADTRFRQLMEKNPYNYYGLQARSRLVEAGKLTLPAGRCPNPSFSESEMDTKVPYHSTEVMEQLSKLVLRFGHLYPTLHRAHTLWRLGMIQDARKELQIIALDYIWTMARGRPKQFGYRPEVERILRGGPVPRRRWTRRERDVLKEGPALRSALGELMQQAGLFYFGWRLGPKHLNTALQRFPQGFPFLVRKVAQRYSLDPNVIWAVMKTESTFRPDALSRVGASGLMQIMPTTGRLIASAMKIQGFHPIQLYDPETNLNMAGWYLRALTEKFNGQLLLIAASYNGGPHNIALWLDQRSKGSDMDEFIEEIPFTESKRYAKKIVTLVSLYERVYCSKDDRIITNSLDPRYMDFPGF